MRQRALLASRVPPGLSRWRASVLPLPSGRGLTPAMAANEDSFFMRSGLSPAAIRRAAATSVPTPRCDYSGGRWDPDVSGGEFGEDVEGSAAVLGGGRQVRAHRGEVLRAGEGAQAPG